MGLRYRSGFSYKDPRQAHILAIKLSRTSFEALLRQASVNSTQRLSSGERSKPVQVQWDPERSLRMGKLPYRSIQIGVGRVICKEYLAGIVEIQDITEKAREMKSLLDEGKDEEARLLLPTERLYPVPDDLRNILGLTG